MTTLKTILISNNKFISKNASEFSIDSIMVDLETHGKAERQKTSNAFLTNHTWSDVEDVSKSIDPKAEFIIRINPYSANTEIELNKVGIAEAATVMLPMVKNSEEVRITNELIKKLKLNLKLLPLIEHIDGFNNLEKILHENPYIEEIYFGLNDLSLSLKLPFLFQCINEGYIQEGSKLCKKKEVSFGFGGIGLLGGKDAIPPRLLISEHVKVGSDKVILSRAFRNQFNFLNSKDSKPSVVEAELLKKEIESLKYCYNSLCEQDKSELESNSLNLQNMITNFVKENYSI